MIDIYFNYELQKENDHVCVYYHNSIVITLFIIIINQNNLLLPMGIKKFKGLTRQEFSILYKFIDNKTYSEKKIKTNT